MLDNEANLNLGYTVSPFGGESRHSTKSRSIYMQMLKSLQHLILNLNEENIELTVQQTMDLYRPKYPYSFNRILSILIYYSFISQREEGDTYLKFIKLIQKKEEEINENDPKIIEVFSSYLNDIQFSQECEYFLEKMIEQNLIEKNIIKKNRSKYFAHYKTEEENKELYDDFFSYIFIQQYDKLSKNDWELHKKYIKEAVNTSEISKIIRNDDLDKLQEISSQAEFDFNQKIKPSLYERFSFINAENVSLIDFAAFFSSVKCFKYLLMNGAKVNNTAKHATAGGNLEIIHLCEQNHSSFEKSYETAIEFHRNDIFKYIYKNKIENLDKNVQNSTFYNIDQNILRLVPPKSDELKSKYLKKLLKYSDREGNYEIFLYLIKEIKIDFKFINMLARNGNLFLVKHFLKEYPIPKNILVPSVSSGNIELVKYVLKHEGIDINAKIFLFDLKIIFLI